jgi:hypothetical protein
MGILISREGTELVGAGNSTSLSAEGKPIVNVADPTNAQDSATKNYVDTHTGAASSALDGTFTINNTTDPTKKIKFDASGIATGTIRAIIMPNSDVTLGLIATAVQNSSLGAANGVATLNSIGKINASQVPAMAITETYVVADIPARNALVIGSLSGQVQTGDVSVVTNATSDTGLPGGASYIYTGSAWQQLLSPTDVVTSVNGITGVVVLTTSNISEGTNLYYTQARFDSAFSAKSTTNLTEGTNLYFTVARALASVLTGLSTASSSAVVATDTILQAIGKLQARSKLNNLISLVAPTATDDSSAGYVNGSMWFNTNTSFLYVLKDATAAAAIWLLETPDISTLTADSGRVFNSGVAGEAFGINQLWLVRRAKSGETAGRYYKALADSFVNSRVVGFIIVGASAVSAAATVRVYKLGEGALGSANTAFGAGNINTPVYLNQSTSGTFTLAPSTSSGAILRAVGYVADNAILEFQPGPVIQA